MRVCRTSAERILASELTAAAPEVAAVYSAFLPGARASVLTRLWRGLVHEPLPWITARADGHDGVTLRLSDGRRLHGPPSDPWSTATTVTALDLGGARHDHPAELMAEVSARLGLPNGPRFTAELDHSVASLALSRAARHERGTPFAVRSPWQWEQWPTDGHPYHPACRARPGFSAAEQLAYAPEHGPVVELRLAAVTDGTVSGAWPDELRDGRSLLIPTHPWQAAHVLDGRPLRPGPPAHPLLSLRTLDMGGNVHVKTAVTTQLTSAVRDISPYSVTHALATSDFAERVARRLDGRLHIARTLAAAGAGTADLAAVLRESPYGYGDAAAGERVVPAAVLPALLGSRPPGERPARAAAFARLALGVCLDLLDVGVALEAHGQNLLVVVDRDDRPLRLVYRDLADIRISPARLARHGIPAPPLTGRLLTDDPAVLRRKVVGCLVTGALAPLAGDAATLATLLDTAVRDLPSTREVRALRTAPLPAKALTAMRLSTGVGGDLWTGLPNPVGAG
ncbi:MULTISPECIES: IucA/IucC family protein [Streptomyces]|uniref:IucA/IucC family protein n=1 Tax=Streptomyces TaxID=1883 RepID=UPI00163B89D5|nr:MULTISPECIES: IucA/IucC family siderophore biosynthesis protein [Streptomyces]MBC2875718.1 IucA/IucC family protein [Streptomyces sp. TYQ1024]UBI37572.1 IucA/IucC family siderophore biosynthesis protein [Streptomyces mobaraensis]UKW30160.1 IucA/IucC family siderophore biosynthesis protein [Streptomyces sp. TYQ1024]